MSSSQYPQENEHPETESVMLTDEDGRLLECFVEQRFALNGASYLLLRPVDAPIAIVAWDEAIDPEEAILLEDDRDLDRVFPDARAVLAEQNLMLKRTAFTPTVEGELPEVQESQILTLELEEEAGTAIDPEEYQFLASFYFNKDEYGVYTPLAPLLFFAKETSFGKLEVLSPEEFREVQPVLEEWMFEDLD
ncbi:protein of unknown function (DUF3727) [Rubidibacter lacunae KORDI 51-2]|uniref:DUF3727 domain-containing protein n=1 Tax=Rubidibacter lacunae KORDI 51-2 TaxID=582515 RepID=U5DKJ1_9CHRO|nr:DUF3727 domain-containing protein [Rubidibacter lacunae]ERN42191.1 protein of unknown function (DUF3727) [Rubidibacter lacunae KORDI 51-2]